MIIHPNFQSQSSQFDRSLMIHQSQISYPTTVKLKTYSDIETAKRGVTFFSKRLLRPNMAFNKPVYDVLIGVGEFLINHPLIFGVVLIVVGGLMLYEKNSSGR